MGTLPSDPALLVSALGLLAGLAFLPLAFKRRGAIQARLDLIAQPAAAPAPVRETPAEPKEAFQPASLLGGAAEDLAALRAGLDRLNRAQEVRLDRVEARLKAIEERLSAAKV